MKKISILLTSLFCLSLFVSPGFAQQPESNADFQLEEAREERSVRTQKFQEVYERVYDKANQKLRDYDGFIGKLESRRAKLAEEGANVEELDKAIRLSKTEYGNVRGAINQFKNSVESIDMSQDIRTIRQDILSEVRTLRSEFRDLHQSLVSAVRIAKNLSR